MVSQFLQGSEGLASSDLVPKMGRYHHGDLAAAAEEALLQGFTLLHEATLTVDRQEDLLARDIKNIRWQASEASQHHQQAKAATKVLRAKAQQEREARAVAASEVEELR
ncbi:hypothetical protein ABZP36_007633 [Zizania latifolia]